MDLIGLLNWLAKRNGELSITRDSEGDYAVKLRAHVARGELECTRRVPVGVAALYKYGDASAFSEPLERAMREIERVESGDPDTRDSGL